MAGKEDNGEPAIKEIVTVLGKGPCQ